ncbi:MAG: glycoside hydrolase family 15 protein [Thermoplasmatota archaeon]
MTTLRGDRLAFGSPGLGPRWTPANKEGVGTAYSADSRVWFTLVNGVLTEAYFPTIDSPQLRDLQLLATDGETYFHEERKDLTHEVSRLPGHALGYRVASRDPAGGYTLHKEIIAHPHLSCVLERVRIEADDSARAKLRLFALCAPHLGGGGGGNNAYVAEVAGREILLAEKRGRWLALGATTPFRRLSCGYVGKSDGWTDLAANFQMDWEFDRATRGNVAMTGELSLEGVQEFTLALAFGEGQQRAVTTLLQALATPFSDLRERYIRQWERPGRALRPLEKTATDGGNLCRASSSLILAHEDKTFPGAFIASLSIPWGDDRSDSDRGGYHLVWTRDMVQAATGMLAAGNVRTPLRALIYLAANQQADGGFPQNFWLNGDPYWKGVQLDEVAYPILLAWKLREERALAGFDPYPMVIRAAAYLVRHGPATQQERWEEASGYSPSTLAANIAALICAAQFARERKETETAVYLEEYADFLECHVERWTTANSEGDRKASPHYIRILPVDISDPDAVEDPERASLVLANQPPGASPEYPAKSIIDAGFLELVRLGVRSAKDPLIVASLQVVDTHLRVETPAGPCWHRYDHDGYGQREDGTAFETWGKGRAWPLLTGERGHYALAASGDATAFIRTMERLASPTGLLPEQVWDEDDLPHLNLYRGKPTDAAMPLVWAHAEYLKLLRSQSDGRVFDHIAAVEQRYQRDRSSCRRLEIWKTNRHARTVHTGQTLRIQASSPFVLHWSDDEWHTTRDTPSGPTRLEFHYVDIETTASRSPIRFTFLWSGERGWEGRDYAVDVIEE